MYVKIMNLTPLILVTGLGFAADKPIAITDKDRAEAFRLQRDIATVQAKFQIMKAQYETAVKSMQEDAATADKQFTDIKTRLQKVCESDGKVLNEAEITCIEKPPAKK